MRQYWLMAVATFTQRWDADRIMGAATITAAFAQFSFWKWSHVSGSLPVGNNRAA